MFLDKIYVLIEDNEVNEEWARTQVRIIADCFEMLISIESSSHKDAFSDYITHITTAAIAGIETEIKESDEKVSLTKKVTERDYTFH